MNEGRNEGRNEGKNEGKEGMKAKESGALRTQMDTREFLGILFFKMRHDRFWLSFKFFSSETSMSWEVVRLQQVSLELNCLK